MTLDVSRALPYGPLERIEVYFEHDGPRLFSLRSVSLGVCLLAMCVDDDDESDEVIFLYLVMGPHRFDQVRSGGISLREAFSTAGPSEIWRVVESYEETPPTVRAEVIPYQAISAEDLPLPGANLRLPTSTAPALDEGELQRWSSQSLRTIAAIELDAAGVESTEFPVRALGLVGTALQEIVDALAQEERGNPTEFGAIPRSVTDDVQMSAIALRAASFALVVGTDKQGAMFDNSPLVEATLGRLVKLVELGAEPESLIGALRDYGPRARRKFTNLLRAVGTAGSGLGVIAAPISAGVNRASMTAGEVFQALGSIDEVAASTTQFEIRRAILTGSNTRLTNFELTDMAAGQRYAGKVLPEAQSQIDGLPVGNTSYVSARLIEEIDFAAGEQESGRPRYMLVSIQPLASTEATSADSDA